MMETLLVVFLFVAFFALNGIAFVLMNAIFAAKKPKS
jgi:hypothetical protein